MFSFAILAFELLTGRLLAMRADFMSGGVDAVEGYVQRRAEVRSGMMVRDLLSGKGRVRVCG